MTQSAEQMETIFATKPSVVPASGYPMPERHQYRVPKRLADVRYQQGVARPAAEVYLERLREMGVVAIGILEDAEPSVRLAAARTGIAVMVNPADKAEAKAKTTAKTSARTRKA